MWQPELAEMLSADTLDLVQQYSKMGQHVMVKKAARQIGDDILGDSDRQKSDRLSMYHVPKNASGRDCRCVTRESMVRDSVGVCLALASRTLFVALICAVDIIHQ